MANNVKVRTKIKARKIKSEKWYDKPKTLKFISPLTNYVFIDESGTITNLKAINKSLANNEEVPFRDQLFVLNAIYMSAYSLKKTYKKICKFKEQYFPNNTSMILHSTDIDSRKGDWEQFDLDNKNAIKVKLDEIIKSSAFIQLATSMNKKDYICKMKEFEEFDGEKILTSVYELHFKRIQQLLNDKKLKATLVIESCSQYKFDRKILQIFCKLKLKKKVPNISAVYFVEKQKSTLYPVGMEIADLTAKPVYKVCQVHEFITMVKKLYNYPRGFKGPMFYVNYENKQNKNHLKGGSPAHAGSKIEKGGN